MPASALPDAVNTIGMNAFQNCALTAFVAPSGLKTVLSTAFGNNSALAAVTLNEGLEVIGANAFQYCPQIKTISIPSTVTKIDINVFWGHGLESVYFLGDTPCEMGTNIFTAYGQGTIPRAVRVARAGRTLTNRLRAGLRMPITCRKFLQTERYTNKTKLLFGSFVFCV